MGLSDKEYLQINQAIFSLANAYDKRLLQESKDEEDPLSVSERGVLLVLGQKQPMNQRQLADVMQLSPGPVSQYVQRLVLRGLIEKEQDQKDRRNWWLQLSPLGEKTYRYTVEGSVLYTQGLVSNLSVEQQSKFKDILLQISHHLGYDW
ncbi:MAG: MarR family transcriptional regulator [Anaerolineaceae bacterium]|nr:MarR family transcriptional regulator [Anaerolineaceae bacterium]